MTTRPPSPNPTADRPIAVVGATGEQGGAVARTLLAQGTAVRALVRDPDAERARALAATGAALAPADLTDEASLRAAFTDASAVFAMASPTPEGGVAAEVQHGRAIARAAAAAGTPHVVYSSVGGVERDSGIPHFESKLEIERALLDLGVPTTFVRPVFFMDNFVRFMTPGEEDGRIVVRLPMPGDVPLQMIAVVDVAAVAVVALLEPGRIPDGAIEIAGAPREPLFARGWQPRRRGIRREGRRKRPLVDRLMRRTLEVSQLETEQRRLRCHRGVLGRP